MSYWWLHQSRTAQIDIFFRYYDIILCYYDVYYDIYRYVAQFVSLAYIDLI